MTSNTSKKEFEIDSTYPPLSSTGTGFLNEFLLNSSTINDQANPNYEAFNESSIASVNPQFGYATQAPIDQWHYLQTTDQDTLQDLSAPFPNVDLFPHLNGTGNAEFNIETLNFLPAFNGFNTLNTILPLYSPTSNSSNPGSVPESPILGPPLASTSTSPPVNPIGAVAPAPLQNETPAESMALADGQKKRKAIVWACDACVHRRVKCEKEGDAEACKKCIAKHIRCVFTPHRPRKERTGKRIEEARSLALTDNGKTHILNARSYNRAKDLKPSSSSSETSSPPNLISSHSSESKLGTTEMTSALTSQLIECFFQQSDHAIPIVDWEDFRWTFERNGRRLSQLTPDQEVIGAFIVALGARASDSPIILGANRVSLESLQQVPTGLTKFGTARNTACSALETKALTLADRHGIYRRSTIESYAVMMLAETINSFTSNLGGDYGYPHFLKHPRVYRANAENIMKDLARKYIDTEEREGRPFVNFQISRPNWFKSLSFSTCFYDALEAPIQGDNLSITSEDLSDFFGDEIASYLDSLQNGQEYLESLRRVRGAQMAEFMITWKFLLSTARFFAQHLSSRRARSKPLDFDRLSIIWNNVDLILQWSFAVDPNLYHRMAQYQSPLFPRPSLFPVEIVKKMNISLLCTAFPLTILINVEPLIRIHRARNLLRTRNIDIDLQYKTQLENFESLALQRQTKCCQLIAQFWMNELALRPTLGVTFSIQSNFSSLPYLTDHLVNAKLSAGFNTQDKLHALENFGLAIRNVAFSWPAATNLVDQIDRAVNLLKNPVVPDLDSSTAMASGNWTLNPTQGLIGERDSLQNMLAVEALAGSPPNFSTDVPIWAGHFAGKK